MKRIAKLFYRLFHFGFFLTFSDYLFEITKFSIIREYKHKKLAGWLKKQYRFFISDFVTKHNTTTLPHGEIPKKIWICWWDGVDKMPPIVKACYNSVLLHADGFQVTVITKHNYNDYTSIPCHIMEKVNNKTMTLTHFSNIIRVSLLYRHGGLWLDATYLVTSTINLNNNSFFTINNVASYNARNISKGRWQGNCIATVPNFYFFEFVFEFLCEYWRKYSFLITYHLYDYSINLAYDSFPIVKQVFDGICPINKNDILKDNLKYEYEPHIFKKAIEDTVFHKLTWKHNSAVMMHDNKLTFYGYILEKYNTK